MQITIGNLAKEFGLSRSTLLYYDSIGLLSPASHAKGEYRLYGENDRKRLELICRYRRAGIALKEIKKILETPETSLTAVLGQRFEDLNREIRMLYEQQRVIAEILQKSDLLEDSEIMTKQRWVALLKASGYSEADMRKWHIRFEQSDPEKHRQFLQFLQIPEEEIRVIRKWRGEGAEE